MPRTHILVLPGGGYHRHADHEGEPVAAWLRTLGIESSVLFYPVLTHHPAPLDAVREEITRLRADGVERVGVIGFSAGGHAAGMAAYAPADGAATAGVADLAILCYPVVSMIAPSHRGSRDNLLGSAPSDALMRATSLELLVGAESPPTFLWHTADDAVVDVVPVYTLASALSAAGVPYALHVYPSGVHGLGLAKGSGLPERWTDEAEAWLRELGWTA